ncbi:MAG: helix-turn-helix domain-containing protein [Kangiella sp.]|nr:helix-turn-helix domain-containing protein [Kangiella sp.]
MTGFGLVPYGEAARLLGLSEVTIRRWVMNRQIPYRKIGSRVFFDPEELREWVENCRVDPQPQTTRGPK